MFSDRWQKTTSKHPAGSKGCSPSVRLLQCKRRCHGPSPAIVEDNDKLYDFLTRGLAECEDCRCVYLGSPEKKIQVIQPPKVSLGVSPNGNLLDFNMEAEGMSLEQLAFLLSKYNRKRKTIIVLKSGRLSPKRKREQSGYGGTAQSGINADGRTTTSCSGHISCQNSVPCIWMHNCGQRISSCEQKPGIRELVRNMKTVEDSDFEVRMPSGRNSSRISEKRGIYGTATLCSNGFGGILADDMGLGKTLQVIVFLYDHYIVQGKTTRNTLIVCPASLVYNWAQECQHFAPELPVCTVAGTAAERRELFGFPARASWTDSDHFL